MIKKIFKTRDDLEEFVSKELIEEFQKPGFILLPAGRTFETEIYPMVEEYFSKHPDKINPKLKLSHLDERITDKKEYLFSEGIKNALPSLQDNFNAIDPCDLVAFEKLLKENGGPSLIYLGLGSDSSRAHVAYIGEEYINERTAKVILSEAIRPEPSVSQALTIGMDVFEAENLESIRVVAIGEEKAESLKAGFSNVNTGLGALLDKYSSKCTILADSGAASLL